MGIQKIERGRYRVAPGQRDVIFRDCGSNLNTCGVTDQDLLDILNDRFAERDLQVVVHPKPNPKPNPKPKPEAPKQASSKK